MNSSAATSVPNRAGSIASSGSESDDGSSGNDKGYESKNDAKGNTLHLKRKKLRKPLQSNKDKKRKHEEKEEAEANLMRGASTALQNFQGSQGVNERIVQLKRDTDKKVTDMNTKLDNIYGKIDNKFSEEDFSWQHL